MFTKKIQAKQAKQAKQTKQRKQTKIKKKIDRKQKKTKRKARGLRSEVRLNSRRAKIFPTNNRSMRNSSPSHRSPIQKNTIMEDMRKKLEAINRLPIDSDTKKIIAQYYKHDLDSKASTIQNKFKTGKIDSSRLKEVFKHEQQYHEIEYDPFNENTILLTKMASNILTKKDKNDSEWKTILAKIYLGLHENLYQGGPRAENYIKTDEYFIKIIQNLYNIDLSNDENWLNDKNNDFLREELIYPYMDTINSVD